MLTVEVVHGLYMEAMWRGDRKTLKPRTCLKGRAPETLLDSYEAERRPIAQRNTDQSVRNLVKMGEIDAALGFETLAPIAGNAAEGPIVSFDIGTLAIDGDTPGAVLRRKAVQDAIDNQAEHFAQGAGIDLGSSYAAGIVVPDGSPPPSSAPCEYLPDAHPGARLPFSSADGRFAESTLGLVDPSGITLFARDARWNAAANAAAGEAEVAVKVVLFDGPYHNLGPGAAELLGITETGAIAVRPDGHVLWRLSEWRADAIERLVAALSLINRGADAREAPVDLTACA
ncbi:hypothetical protein [Edaphosphingomonas haloaromaticamans]|uniref:2,4-dichlorophenol 6-monooxygenase n=1 Tax=Edaphosphingomonas haloaromaticamans TaxID=653954 RepID=A0A1S1HHD3_9SPHN|nr:hypothetical protein [Sphingomonas haloaromaticamans]OHT20643.1 2,4-dichlorophenol 6-monooxygenase [Sphingomonas haloaromaticamans]